jgi:hypothetical protein
VTSAEIAQRILIRADDSYPASLSITADPAGGIPAEILAVINEGQELVTLLTLCLEATAPFTATAGTAFFGIRTVLPDYLVPLRVLGPAGRLRPATLKQLDAANEQWQQTLGTPARYVAMGFNLFAITPQVNADTQLTVTYARAPVQIVGDQFPEIPEEYHIDLVDYGIYRVRLKEGAQGLQRGMKYLNRFLDRMTVLGDFVRARSRAANFDILPMELALFDRSRLIEQVTAKAAGK